MNHVDKHGLPLVGREKVKGRGAAGEDPRCKGLQQRREMGHIASELDCNVEDEGKQVVTV